MVVKRHDKIISQIRHRIPKKAMKFGVEVPGSVEEAYKLDQKNGNDFWAKAIAKELKNIIVAFKLLEPGDVKFDLTRKARFVADGHRHKDVPAHTTFSAVASRDSVRIGFLADSLNVLEIMA